MSGDQSPVGIVMPLATLRGGSEVMLLNMLRANRLLGLREYSVCFLEDGPMRENVIQMGYAAELIQARRLRQVHHYLRTVYRLARWCRERKIRHVMSWMEKAHLYGGPAALLAGVSSSWWLHSADPASRVMRLVTAVPTSRIFCTSQTAKQVQLRRWPRHESTVCHGAADLQKFEPSRLPTMELAKSQLGLPLDRPVIGLVARLQRWKGINVFLDAASKVLSAGRQAFFVVVGGEHQLEPGVKQELELQIERLGISHHVRMAGFQANVPLWMQAFDTCVHASTGVEPFGIVIVEAMSLGKLTIASATGGPQEIITDGMNGRLTPPGDSTALARAMLQSLDATAHNLSIRENARRRAQEFGSDRLARDVDDVLTSVIQAPAVIRV